MKIRDAVPEGAEAACQVLRRSIIELCAADHRHDPAILEAWLSNKTPECVGSWITQPGSSVMVAVETCRILAVGRVDDSGHITLCYVSPDARFRGVSRALLGAMEARARERGNTRCTLESSETAHRFYLASGYADDGTPAGLFGTASGYPMSKTLKSKTRSGRQA
jgi:GNAT superfamily N-acetyltransferase